MTKPIGGLWLGETNNEKTGNVPTLAVGETREQSMRSCGKCPLLKRNSPDRKARCYSQHGTVAIAHAQMVKTNKTQPGRYTFARAMMNRRASAKMARFGSIGDAAAIERATLEPWIQQVKTIGLRVVGYTSQYDEPFAQWLRGVFMASAKSIEEADRLVADGWRATVVVPRNWTGPTTTPAGNRLHMCPAIAAARKGAELQCNNCHLCDGSQAGPIVVFPDHGPQARKGITKTEINGATKRQAIARFKTLHTDRVAVGIKPSVNGWTVSSVAA